MTPATAAKLIEAVNSKHLDTSEFSTSALQAFTNVADVAFYDVNYESGLKIVNTLCQVIETKKTRLMKFA